MTATQGSDGEPKPALSSRFAMALRVFTGRLRVRRERTPIDSAQGLAHFVSTRAAFVAQKTLYGYLKTRMGTRYPSMFEDDVFVASIDIAKLQVYTACLADLSIFAAANALEGSDADETKRRWLATQCFAHGIDENAGGARQGFSPAAATEAFLARLNGIDWPAAGRDRSLFDASAQALYRWAPIAPELKRHDREVVTNSIRFAWHEVRRDFSGRLDGRAIFADMQRPDAP